MVLNQSVMRSLSLCFHACLYSGRGTTPSAVRNRSNFGRASGFVKMSATFSFVPTCSMDISFYSIFSLIKCYLISMCFVRSFKLRASLVVR